MATTKTNTNTNTPTPLTMSTTTTFSTMELYGGAITVELPSGWIDARYVFF